MRKNQQTNTWSDQCIWLGTHIPTYDQFADLVPVHTRCSLYQMICLVFYWYVYIYQIVGSLIPRSNAPSTHLSMKPVTRARSHLSLYTLSCSHSHSKIFFLKSSFDFKQIKLQVKEIILVYSKKGKNEAKLQTFIPKQQK